MEDDEKLKKRRRPTTKRLEMRSRRRSTRMRVQWPAPTLRAVTRWKTTT